MQTRKHPAGVTRRTLAAVPIALGCLVAAGCATWSVDSVDADRRTVVVNAGPFFQPDSAELLRPDERALDVAAQGCSLVMDQYRIVAVEVEQGTGRRKRRVVGDARLPLRAGGTPRGRTGETGRPLRRVAQGPTVRCCKK